MNEATLAASFLFLAFRNGEPEVVDEWSGEGLEGRQFYCHPVCFTGHMDPTVRSAVFDSDF